MVMSLIYYVIRLISHSFNNIDLVLVADIVTISQSVLHFCNGLYRKF